jgi:predicted RNA-binding Zn ribbon-like protein
LPVTLTEPVPASSRFDLIGGAPAIDLVNTISWRGDPARRLERIADFEALVAWARRAHVLEPSSARRLTDAARADAHGSRRTTAEVHRLREHLHGVLSTLIDDGRPDPAGLEAVNAHIATAIANALPCARLPLDWRTPLTAPEDLHHALSLEALRLLQQADPRRIGRCSDPACGWLFLDHSRNRSRRWCSSGDCGNRDRVNRHHARNR